MTTSRVSGVCIFTSKVFLIYEHSLLLLFRAYLGALLFYTCVSRFEGWGGTQSWRRRGVQKMGEARLGQDKCCHGTSNLTLT